MGTGSSMGSRYKREDIEVQWYGVQTEESRNWLQKEDGFGQARNKSFLTGAMVVPGMNRKGNIKGELRGKIVFFSGANSKSNYSSFPAEPTFNIDAESKVFAKAFLESPLGMTPISENNLVYKKYDKSEGAINYKGFGPVLLAPVARAFALFVNVDGVQQTNEIFCTESQKMDDNIRHFHDENDNEEEEEDAEEEEEDAYEEEAIKQIITSPIPGSFVTHAVSRAQDIFFFIHYPILANHEDCFLVDTGPYPFTVAEAFHKLFNSLSPGKHKVRISLQMYYDHSEFRYFVLDRNMNPKGEWHEGLPNDFLKSPHPDPMTMTSPTSPLAEGCFTVILPPSFQTMFEGLLDRKPPKERYKDEDLDELRKEAGLVAMGRICKRFEYIQGMPDITVLITKKLEMAVKEKGSDYRHTYDYIEFAACWLDPDDSSPMGTALMFEGAMAKGEVTAKEYSQTWTWHNVTRGGDVIETEPLKVKNRYILARMVERRRSQISMNLLALPKRT